MEEYRGMYAACMAAEQEEADAKARLEDVKRRHGELESATLSDLDFANGSTEAASWADSFRRQNRSVSAWPPPSRRRTADCRLWVIRW